MSHSLNKHQRLTFPPGAQHIHTRSCIMGLYVVCERTYLHSLLKPMLSDQLSVDEFFVALAYNLERLVVVSDCKFGESLNQKVKTFVLR